MIRYILSIILLFSLVGYGQTVAGGGHRKASSSGGGPSGATVISGSGCAVQGASGVSTASCTDASAASTGDTAYVYVTLYDNHTVTLTCSSCGTISTLSGYPTSSVNGLQQWVFEIKNMAAGGPYTYFVTDSASPANGIVVNAVRVAHASLTSPTDVVGTPTNTTTTTLTSANITTSTTNELIMGACMLEHNDPLSPGTSPQSMSATNVVVQNNLVEYGTAATAGTNYVTCTQPFAGDNGTINVWAVH